MQLAPYYRIDGVRNTGTIKTSCCNCGGMSPGKLGEIAPGEPVEPPTS